MILTTQVYREALPTMTDGDGNPASIQGTPLLTLYKNDDPVIAAEPTLDETTPGVYLLEATVTGSAGESVWGQVAIPGDPPQIITLPARIIQDVATQASVDGVPTTAEFNARTLPEDEYATQAALIVATNSLNDLVTAYTAHESESEAAIAAVKADTAAIKLTTDKLDDTLEDDAGTYRFTTNALEQAPSGGSSASTRLANTTIATLTSQTVFTLTAGSTDNDTYNNALVVITDQSTSTQKSFRLALDYVGSTKTLTLNSAPTFTIAVGDTVEIFADAAVTAAGSITVTPVLSTVSSGEVAGDDITIYQGETKAFVFTLTTDAGVAIDESGDTLKLVVRHVTTAAQIFEVTGTVGGASNNQITVTVDGQYTATPQTYRYELWNVTEDVVRARGAFLIVKAGQPT